MALTGSIKPASNRACFSRSSLSASSAPALGPFLWNMASSDQNSSLSDFYFGRPTRIERRARLVNAIARGRRWLDEIVSDSATNIQQIATRQKCSVRQVNMTISLAFLAPNFVKAAVEGRLPRGIGVERLRDAPAEWSRQFETLGLNPQWGWKLLEARFSAADSRTPAGQLPSQIQSRGTEFLDAETGGQKSTRQTVMVGRDPERSK